jgi:hypothetical protein
MLLLTLFNAIWFCILSACNSWAGWLWERMSPYCKYRDMMMLLNSWVSLLRYLAGLQNAWCSVSSVRKITAQELTYFAGRWWHTPLIPALGRQRQADFWVWGQPGLQSEFQDSQSYTEKPCLEKPKKKKKKQKLTYFFFTAAVQPFSELLDIIYACKWANVISMWICSSHFTLLSSLPIHSCRSALLAWVVVSICKTEGDGERQRAREN